MIERSKARLEEALSFLRKLRDEKSKQVQQCSPTASAAFFSALDSFIIAARSARWVLQSEEREKYDAWKSTPGATVTAIENDIFNLVTEMRNSIEKRGHACLEARRERVEIPENPDPFSGSQYFGLPDWGRPTTLLDVYYAKGTNYEVVSICEQYFAILTRLIGDFEQKHR
jgi:hypothetical protein